MAQRYLYPRSRARELQGAIFIGGFGMYVKAIEVFGGGHPLQWLGLTLNQQTMLSASMVISAFVWAAGISINGRWIGSPFLRCAAMLFNFCVAGFAAWQGFGTTAFYTYSWVALFVASGVVNTARDCRAAFKGYADGIVVG